MKTQNPYAPLHPSKASALAAEVCPQWRMVSVVLDATLPGRAWPKQAFAVGWTPPPPGIPGDGPPAWYELRADGSGRWHEGKPPAPCGVVCDPTWRPVEIVTASGRRLPNLEVETKHEV